MSTCLFGFVLHTLAAPERLAQSLVALGILFLLVSPGKPPADEPANPPYGTIGLESKQQPADRNLRLLATGYWLLAASPRLDPAH